MRTKKSIPFYLILALCVFFLSSCSPQKNNSEVIPPHKEPLPISFLHYFSGSLSGGIDTMVQQFNDSQEAYKLQAVAIDHESFKTSSVTSFQTNPADLYSYWAGSKVTSNLDLFEPFDEIWHRNHLDALFPKAIIDSACTYNNQIYMLPITQHYVCFFYNKAVFEKLDLKEPKNYDELLIIAEKLKLQNITPFALGSKNKWPAQFWFDYLLLGTAGYSYRESLMNGTAHYSDPEVERVFEMWSDLLTKGYFNASPELYDWSEAPMDDLINGRSAMMLMGTWAIQALENPKYDFEADVDYGCFSFPIIDPSISQSALGPIDGLIIPKNATHIQGAEAAITFFASTEAQTAMSKGSGAFAPSILVPYTTYSPLQIKLLQAIEDRPYWAFNYDLATPPAISNIGLNLFSEFIIFPEHYNALLKEANQQIDDAWTTLK